MIYLLDTTAVSELMRQNTHTWSQLLAQKRDHVFLCEIVVAELFFGLGRLKDSRKKRLLQKELNPILETIRSLAWDRRTSEFFVFIKADLYKRGEPVADMDIAIAAHALRYESVLVTDNLKDFQRIKGLHCVAWKSS